MTTPPNPAFQVTVLTDLFSEYNDGKDRIVQQLEDDGQRHMDWLIEATKVSLDVCVIGYVSLSEQQCAIVSF